MTALREVDQCPMADEGDWGRCAHPKGHAGPHSFDRPVATPSSNQWVSLAERQPPKDCARLLVTNNITARDAYDHFCHLWLVHMVHKQDDGSFAAFDDHDRKIHGLTHWRYAVPEESSVETQAELTREMTVAEWAAFRAKHGGDYWQCPCCRSYYAGDRILCPVSGDSRPALKTSTEPGNAS